MYLLDTNIFLEVLLARSRKDGCKSLLDAFREGRLRGFVTYFSVYSIMLIMSSFKRPKELKIFLTSLSAYHGLAVYQSGLKDKVRATEISVQRGLDMDDSVQYSSALALGVKGIVSFDKHFEGLEVPRVEPIQLIK